MAPATDPDAIALAFIAVLRPGGALQDGRWEGGTPVGTIGAVVNRTPDAPYRAPTPIVTVTPAIDQHGRDPAVALAKFETGWVEIVYRDLPAQQQDGKSQAQIEDALWANRRAIIAAIDANPTLGGAVTIAGELTEGQYNPDGPFEEWQGAEWLGFTLRCSYMGPLLS